MKSTLTHNQKIKKEKFYTENGKEYRITCTIRHDDECRNGHNSFSVTGDIHEKTRIGWRHYSGGCIHEEIVKHFPEYAHLLKWHLMSTDEGPMHYIANTVYLAGDRDHWGKLKGEVKSYATRVKFGNFPIGFKYENAFLTWLRAQEKNKSGIFADAVTWQVIPVQHPPDTYKFGDKYTITGYEGIAWYQCPFDTVQEAREFIIACLNFPLHFVETPDSWGEGKERELDAARRCAVWPDATDEELTAPDLKDRLLARLPKLLEDFRRDIEALGMVF